MAMLSYQNKLIQYHPCTVLHLALAKARLRDSHFASFGLLIMCFPLYNTNSLLYSNEKLIDLGELSSVYIRKIDIIIVPHLYKI